MFEQEFDNMFADIWFDDRDTRLADEEGIGFFETGNNIMQSIDALIIIRKYDNSLNGDHHKSKRNRLIAQRNSIVTAFGPEMADRAGYAK